MVTKINDNVLTRTAAWLCGSLSILSLVAGFILAGSWQILFVVPASALLLFLARKVPPKATLSILLVVYLFLAAGGLLADLSPYLMIAGCSFALAGWESAMFLLNVANSRSQANNRRIERLHFDHLVVAVGLGLVLALLGLNVPLHLPFGLIAGLALLAAYALYRGLRTFIR